MRIRRLLLSTKLLILKPRATTTMRVVLVLATLMLSLVGHMLCTMPRRPLAWASLLMFGIRDNGGVGPGILSRPRSHTLFGTLARNAYD